MSGHDLNAAQWTWHVPQRDSKTGEQLASSFLVQLNGRTAVNFECRSEDGVTVHAIDSYGQPLFIGKGTIVRFSGRVKGFVGLEIVCAGTFAFCADARSKWIERPDPRRLQVSMPAPVDPVQQMVQQELKKMVSHMRARDMFADDEAVMELLEDIESGDLDFDDEPELFGPGHMEQEMAPEAPQDAPEPKKAPSPPAKQKGASAPPTPPAETPSEPDGS